MAGDLEIGLPAPSGAARLGGIPLRVAGALRMLAVAGAATAGAALGALPPRLGLAAVLGVVAAVAVIVGDGWLTLYVAAQPLQGVSLLGVQAFGFRISHVFFLVVLLLLAWRILARRVAPPRLGLLDALTAAFVGYSLLSIVWSAAPLSSSLVSGGKLAFDLFVFLGLSALVQHDPVRSVRTVALGFGIAFVYMAGTALYFLSQVGFKGMIAGILLGQGATGSEALRNLNDAITPFAGVAGRNIIAGWMALGVMIIWGTLSGRWREIGRWQRVAWLIAFVAVAGYILLSLSRGTWLSLAVAAPVLWWRSGHRIKGRAVAWMVVGGLVLVVAGTASGLLDVAIARVGVVSSAVDPAVSTRFENWAAVLGQFASHPLFGVGIKGTEALSRAVSEDAANAHNIYIQVLGELGLVGALIFYAMVGVTLWRLWRAGNVLPAPLDRMAWGLFVAFACYLAQSLTQAEFMDLGIWTVMGLAAGLIHLSASPPAAAPAPGA